LILVLFFVAFLAVAVFAVICDYFGVSSVVGAAIVVRCNRASSMAVPVAVTKMLLFCLPLWWVLIY